MSILIDQSDIGASFERIKNILDKAKERKEKHPNTSNVMAEAELEVLMLEGMSLVAGLLKDLRTIATSLQTIAQASERIATSEEKSAISLDEIAALK